VLSDRPILGTSAEAAGITPRVQFVSQFYTSGLGTVFSTEAALKGWYTESGNGMTTIDSNLTFDGNATLKVLKQNYSAVYSPSVEIPLLGSDLSFTVYPEVQAIQPDIALGVVLQLSNGHLLAAISNWNGTLPQSPNVYVWHVNLDSSEWNTVNLNLTNISKALKINGASSLAITQVQLQGGLGPRINWANVFVDPSLLSEGSVISSLRSYGVGYVIINSSVPNGYLQGLESAGILAVVHSDGPIEVLKVT
jgi:hypothetical protein